MCRRRCQNDQHGAGASDQADQAYRCSHSSGRFASECAGLDRVDGSGKGVRRRRRELRCGTTRSLCLVPVILAAALLELGNGAEGSESTALPLRQVFTDRESRHGMASLGTRGQMEDMNEQLQVAKRQSSRGRALMMISTPMLTGGLGDGLVSLIALYILLFLSVMFFLS